MKHFAILREFKKDELVLDEKEARVVLKFIFADTSEPTIDGLPMSDELRGFAQALLITAIDATYSVGLVEGLFRVTADPTKGALKVIKGFAKKAAKHWFKHAKASDLSDVRIYDFVRDELARRFKSELVQKTLSKQESDCCGAFVLISRPQSGLTKVWG